MASTTSQNQENVPAPAQRQSSPFDASNTKVVILTLSVFLGPWCVWWTRIAEGQGWIHWHLPLGVALWTITPVLFLAVAETDGRAGVRDLAHRLIRWRVPARCYLFALLVPPAIATLTASIAALGGVTVKLGDVLGASGAAIYFTYGIGLFLLTEEAGWRGVVLPRLQARMTPLTASLLLGAIWAVWHIPSLHIPGETDQGLSLPVFAVLVISTSVLIAALVNASRGSVLIAAVFHASFDASYAYIGVVGGEDALLVIAAVLSVLCAVAVSVRTRGRLYYRDDQGIAGSGGSVRATPC
jgi:membrane protease YdiL (CAAX protease family)